MDRLDALAILIAVLDEGSLAAAARKLGRSPAAITRALAAVERRAGAALLDRRPVRLTEAGVQFALKARAALAAFDALSETESGLNGVLTLTAPISAGSDLLRPAVDEFLDAFPNMRARLLLFDRIANLAEEGLDLALRIARLPSSSLIAFPVGQVRRVVCAAPAYLAQHRPPAEPGDLATHAVITLAESHQEENWSFPLRDGGSRVVGVQGRLAVNNIAAARAAAIEGRGLVRLFSYQIADAASAGKLVIVLEDFEGAPVPAQLVTSKERLATAKVRAFADFAAPRLRAAFSAALSALARCGVARGETNSSARQGFVDTP